MPGEKSGPKGTFWYGGKNPGELLNKKPPEGERRKIEDYIARRKPELQEERQQKKYRK